MSPCAKPRAELAAWCLRLTPCGLQCWCSDWARLRLVPSVGRTGADAGSSSPHLQLCTSGALRRLLPPGPSLRRHPAGKRTPRSLSRRSHGGGVSQALHPPPPPSVELPHSPRPHTAPGPASTRLPALGARRRPSSAPPRPWAAAPRRRQAGSLVEEVPEQLREGFRSKVVAVSEGARPPPRSQEACNHSRTLKVSKHVSPPDIMHLQLIIYKSMRLT